MQSNIQIKNTAEVCVIDIEGTIGIPEEWQFEEPASRITTYEKFKDTVRRIEQIEASEIVVNIRSTGGDVNDALLIYEALRSLPAHITTRCYGYTASAATLIAQAASEGARELSANALYLIHNSICTTEGNAEELTAKLDLLRKTDIRLSEVYAARSGQPAQTFATLMSENNGNGRWLAPDEVVEAGLADLLIDSPAVKPASLSKNIADKWNGMLARIGLTSETDTDPLPADRNVLHFGPEQEQTKKSIITLQDAQQRVAPTATKPKEDPSISDTSRSTNDKAYADDARRFAKF
ncbi:MAG: Clp protease ClpP [Alistipes sp.]